MVVGRLPWILVGGLLVFASVARCSRSSDDLEAEFVSIFNGGDLSGWTGDSRYWSVEDGALVGRISAGAPLATHSHLRFERPVGDFHLRFQYQIDQGNSGVVYRGTGEDDASLAGYQADIVADSDLTGIVYEQGEGARGIIARQGERIVYQYDRIRKEHLPPAPLVDARAKTATGGARPWTRYEIIARGPEIIHMLDGEPVAGLRDEDPRRLRREGVLALQLHAGGAMEVRFKDLELAKLPPSDWIAPEIPAPPPPRAEWIWAREGASDGEELYFRATFEVRNPLKEAWLRVTGDDHHQTWVNGKAAKKGDGWDSVDEMDVAGLLRPGTNVLAVAVKNDGGPGGLLFDLDWTDGSGAHRVASNRTTRVAATAADGWRDVAFDDGAASEFTDVYSYGPHNAHHGPWSDVFRRRSATPVSAIDVPDGFQLELLHSARPSEGSWVSMTFDDKGRILVSPQGGPLLQMTLGDAGEVSVKNVDLPVQACQGLLYAYGGLYANQSGDKEDGGGLYRCEDTDGDGELDRSRLLIPWGYGGEHGCHGVILGPDGRLFVVNGNHCDLPPELAESSPHRGWAEDMALSRAWDPRGHAVGKVAPGGYIVTMNKDGGGREMFCAGQRNAYDIAFNDDGELFTYDSDMEWDEGLPWYRAPRVLHLVSGADHGWRSGSGKWPTYYVDSLPEVVDTDLSSPTGVVWGGGSLRTDPSGAVVRGPSAFPEPWRSRLLIADWAYGRIVAVDMQEDGATYRGEWELFCAGKPLNVADLEFGPDGALYFVTGGRGTQSGLYRVSWTGSTQDAARPSIAGAAAARERRRALETFHHGTEVATVDRIFTGLRDVDRHVRYAARVALERLPVAGWRDRALAEQDPFARANALAALARVGSNELPRIAKALATRDVHGLARAALLDELRAVELALLRQSPGNAGDPAVDAADPSRRLLLDRYNARYPSLDPALDRELFAVLSKVGARDLVGRTLDAFDQVEDAKARICYAFLVRDQKEGWTPALRTRHADAIAELRANGKGGASFLGYLRAIQETAFSGLPEDERTALEARIDARLEASRPAPVVAAAPIARYSLEQLATILGQRPGAASFQGGAAAFKKALCAECHRFGGAGGSIGPDLTGVGSRFGREDLLLTLLDPSKDISSQYEDEELTLDDGSVVVGRVVLEDRTSVHLEVSPLAPRKVSVYKGRIKSRRVSPVSPMPERLVDGLSAEEIRNLIAYLESGGDSTGAAFR